MNKIAPKKSLGQNFLQDKKICSKIVNLAGDIENKRVFEIGPGMGAITGLLLEKKANLTCVEIDLRSVDFMKDKFANVPNFSIIHTDILKFDIRSYMYENKIDVPVTVIGNIPYNISSEIFFWLYDNSDIIDKAILTIQKEVAKRLTASTKTKSCGVLTAAMSMNGTCKAAFDIAGGSFFPKPAVTSTVIVMEFDKEKREKYKYKSVYKLVRAAFSQRRKMISNSLKHYIESSQKSDMKEILADEKAALMFNQRAEELTIDDFLYLYNLINKES